jgi:hypothetical protein
VGCVSEHKLFPVVLLLTVPADIWMENTQFLGGNEDCRRLGWPMNLS